MKKAILFGASGFVGSCLLNELLQNPDYEHVTIVVRKELNIKHPKLTTLIGDYNTLLNSDDNIMRHITADDIFITLGTTKKKTPNPDKYYQIDHDYPVLAAKLAQKNGAQSIFLVTAIGANVNSNIFYLRTKGETERDIIPLNFKHTHIFRPSVILGNRKENRFFERILIKIWSIVNPLFIGKMNCYKGIDAKNIAIAMNNAAKNQTKKVTIYTWKEMQLLLK